MNRNLMDGNANKGASLAASLAVSKKVIAGWNKLVRPLQIFLAPRSERSDFGCNITYLALTLSRLPARTWAFGDEIIVKRIDHAANINPWITFAETQAKRLFISSKTTRMQSPNMSVVACEGFGFTVWTLSPISHLDLLHS